MRCQLSCHPVDRWHAIDQYKLGNLARASKKVNPKLVKLPSLNSLRAQGAKEWLKRRDVLYAHMHDSDEKLRERCALVIGEMRCGQKESKRRSNELERRRESSNTNWMCIRKWTNLRKKWTINSSFCVLYQSGERPMRVYSCELIAKRTQMDCFPERLLASLLCCQSRGRERVIAPTILEKSTDNNWLTRPVFPAISGFRSICSCQWSPEINWYYQMSSAAIQLISPLCLILCR